jgi:hypothetical protein
MTRTLLNGDVVKEYEYPIDIVIHTKCPEKWKLIDMETGQEYIGTNKIENKNVDFLTWIKNGLKPSVDVHYGSWKKYIKNGKNINA